MRYSIKTEVYNEKLPFNKWFNFETPRKEKLEDLMEILEIDKNRIGLVIINNKPITTNKILKDKDSIRFLGRIYSEYL